MNDAASRPPEADYTPPIQFSLRTMLIAMAIISVLLAPLPKFGMAYGTTMLFALGVMLFTWTISVRVSHMAAFGVSLFGALLGFLAVMGSVPFFLYTLFNAGACLLLLPLRPNPKITLAVLAIALLIPFATVMWYGINDLQSYDELRLNLPMRSLEDRLAKLESSRQGDGSLVKLASVVSVALDDQEQDSEPPFYGRSRALENLHDASYRRFVASQGFGPARMGNRFSPRRLEFDHASGERLPLALDSSFAKKPDSLHRYTIYDFADADRMGYVRTINKVAGFEGHAFTRIPETTSPRDDRFLSWQLTQLQLVSLLRNETPVAYLTESLPEMQDIEQYPHRALNEFEKNALPKLRAERDVVIDITAGAIQMLGAVRAGKSCLECHTDHHRGDLLGAFSYKIQKEGS